MRLETVKVTPETLKELKMLGTTGDTMEDVVCELIREYRDNKRAKL